MAQIIAIVQGRRELKHKDPICLCQMCVLVSVSVCVRAPVCVCVGPVSELKPIN